MDASVAETHSLDILADPEQGDIRTGLEKAWEWIDSTHTDVMNTAQKTAEAIPEWLPVVGPLAKSMGNQAEMGLIAKGTNPETHQPFIGRKEQIGAYLGAFGRHLFHQAEAAFDVIAFVAPEAELPKVVVMLHQAAKANNAREVVKSTTEALTKLGKEQPNEKGGAVAGKMGDMMGHILKTKMAEDLLVRGVEGSEGWKKFIAWMPGQTQDSLRTRWQQIRPVDVTQATV